MANPEPARALALRFGRHRCVRMKGGSHPRYEVMAHQSGSAHKGEASVLKTLRVETIDEWRSWLDEHHASEPEVWLVYYRKGTGITSVAHSDVLDEALCFGWIDSLVKRLDDRRFAIKFTPRKADSRWSDVNRKRYAVLKASGRLEPSGIARSPTGRKSASRPQRRELPKKLPAYIANALKKRPAALRTFESLPTEERRRYFAWINSAKREETKLKRLSEALKLLAVGKRLGLK